MQSGRKVYTEPSLWLKDFRSALYSIIVPSYVGHHWGNEVVALVER